MERLLAVLILICLGRNVDGAEPKPVYFVVGKNVTLRPPSGSQTIDTGVIWRHYEDFAAEWSKGDPVEYYRDFKGRTVLDTETGAMTISDMTAQLAGVYSVEINNRRLEDDKYVVKSVKEPPPPNVWPKPKTTEGPSEIELECEWNVTEKAGPVEYWWKTDQSWVKRDKTIVVTNNETTQRVETFSCKISNIAGEAESKPWPNPFYQKDNSASVALGIILPVAILLVLAGLGYWKRDVIKPLLCRYGEPNVVPTDYATVDTTADSKAAEETVYANDKP